jgi:hypothetical protein
VPKPLALVKQNTGNLRQGNPGNRGGGDKPKTYKLWLASLLDSEKHRKEFAATMEDRNTPAFIAATKHAAAYAHGMPTQAIEVKDTTPDKEMTGEDVRRRLLGAVPALIQTLPGNAQERAQLLADLKAVETAMEDE